MTKRFGFTLAEVLITLGIIGVVAAMTIPTLISNTHGAQFKTAYKKALSTLNQAVVMNVALEDTDLSTLDADTSNAGDNPTTGSLGAMLSARMQSATDITDSYFAASPSLGGLVYRKTVTCTDAGVPADECTAADEEVETNVTLTAPSATTWKVFSFADGTSFGYLKTAADCNAIKDTCIGFIDVNGSTGPNTPIVCTKGVEGGTGAANGTTSGTCEVESSGVTDIYPVYLHGQTVEPASDAARAVLFGK